MSKHSLPYRVLAIHDICGLGRCSLVAAVSILSHLGNSVCPLATASFSVNTSYSDFEWKDLSETLLPFIGDYHKRGIHFDSIYSGYLGNEKQTQAILKASMLWTSAYKLIDPVFADSGTLYPHFDISIVESFRSLIKQANLITPNITEASYLLTGKPDQIKSLKDAKQALLELSNNRKINTVITSVEDADHPEEVGIVGFDKNSQNQFEFFSKKREDAKFCGTGDILASTLLGLILSGRTFEDALSISFKFINKTIDYTLELQSDTREGIVFEPCLKSLS